MHIIRVRNVNAALPAGLKLLAERGREQDSRVGRVRSLPEPCTTVYERPEERVLFWPARDANPFFHLFEALWMLGGRNDLAFPKRFNKRFDAYSDDGVTVHGAYGHRWRSHFGLDQVEGVVNLLGREPTSRRAVIAMWDPAADLGRVSRDLPCNTTLYPRVREGCLDLTVLCRSNDIIWGAYGANAVHMSMLQEYLAGRLGVEVGCLYQVSNDYHAYLDVFEPLRRALEEEPGSHLWHDAYELGTAYPFKLLQNGEDWRDWHQDLSLFLDSPHAYGFNTAFFRQVVMPLFAAWRGHEVRDYTAALANAERCAATDWRLAATGWLERRAVRARLKDQPQGSLV